MKKLVLTIASGIYLAGCSVFGVRTVEQPDYTVVAEDGSIEVRQYPALLAARTEVDADYEQSSSVAFRRLAGYIFGDNQSGDEIAMTAPVLQQPAGEGGEGEEIAMTAPVLQQPTDSGAGWTMTFVMPSQYTLETLPKPTDPAIEIVTLPARTVAAIRYSWWMSEQRIEEHAAELQAWLENNGYRAVSAPRSAGYDPPWTIPFLRRNEVHIDIEKNL